MANLQGGIILIGVEDDGSISGIQRNDLETWIMDTVFGHYVHPLIVPYYEEIPLDNNKRIAVVSFDQGTAKPYVLRHNNREEIYIRLGSTSRHATREQQLRLFQTGEMLHAESLPVSGTSFESFDLARLQDYLLNIIMEAAIPQNKEEWEYRLTGLGLMVNGIDNKCKCTIAGLVLFGRNPRGYLKHAGLRWMSFTGTDKDYSAQDDVFLNAPLVALGKGQIGRGRSIEEPGLIERALDRMRPFISLELNTLEDGLRRVREYRYPEDVIRESLVNGMAHRDWTRSLEVEAVNYSDRIEIISPGALQNSMTLKKILAGQRSIRNTIIMETLRDYGYVDMRGMGVRRKIVPLTREFTGKDARFEATEDYFQVVIPARQISGEA
jgi:ATP-dependent DNA helicase RecG